MLPLESLRNLLFMMWRRRPFLLAVVMITTLILLVLQYQSITTGDANHVQSKSYSAFSSIRAEAVVIRDHPSDLEYRFDGQGAMDAPQQQNNQPVDSVDQSRYKVSSSYRSTAPSKPEEQFRLVHFDLKGAPPKIQYILKILPLVKQAGANGKFFSLFLCLIYKLNLISLVFDILCVASWCDLFFRCRNPSGVRGHVSLVRETCTGSISSRILDPRHHGHSR